MATLAFLWTNQIDVWKNKYFALCARFNKYTKEYWFTKKIEHCTISRKIDADEYYSKLTYFADKGKL